MGKSVANQSYHKNRFIYSKGYCQVGDQPRIMTFTMCACELLNHKIIRKTQANIAVVTKEKVEVDNLIDSVNVLIKILHNLQALSMWVILFCQS